MDNLFNLNTSYVKVKQIFTIMQVVEMDYLNTSYVKVKHMN